MDISQNWVEGTATIRNQFGVHFRAASAFAQTAQPFQSEIRVSAGQFDVDGKSAMQFAQLAAQLNGLGVGTRLLIRASGPDALEAVQALTRLVENRFGEEK